MTASDIASTATPEQTPKSQKTPVRETVAAAAAHDDEKTQEEPAEQAERPQLTRSTSIKSFFKKSKKDAYPSDVSASSTPHGKKRKRRALFGFINSNAASDEERHDSGNDTTSINDHNNHNEHSDGDDEEDHDDSNDEDGGRARHKSKRVKTKQLTAEEIAREEEKIAFEKREAELDAELEPQYRKFRPRGFKFNPPPQDRPIRIYADGVFDLFHLGHMRQLEQAKKSLPNVTLICGVPSDEETHRRKGLTVLTDKQRCDTLEHCKWVDEVIPDSPWCVTPAFLDEHDIDYVAHDDLPYASADSDDIYMPIKAQGKFLTTQRTEGISTSDIITKIIRDYDKYLMRNFARGASRQELNVSWLKKNELDLKRHVKEFRESFKTRYENASKDLYTEIRAYINNTLGKKKRRRSVHASGSSGSSTAAESGSAGDGRADKAGSQATGSTNAESEEGGFSDESEDESEAEGGGKPLKRESSPVTEFVNGYAGNSVVGTVKGWLSRKSSAPNSPPGE